MTTKSIYLIILAAAITGCGQTEQKNKNMTTNPLLEKWSGHYNGVPPFDKIKVEQFVPAFEAAMSEKQKEIDAIANNTQ